MSGELQDWIKQSSAGHLHIKLQLHFLIGKVFLFVFLSIYLKTCRSPFTVYLLHSSFTERLPASIHAKVNAKVLQYKKKQSNMHDRTQTN